MSESGLSDSDAATPLVQRMAALTMRVGAVAGAILMALLTSLLSLLLAWLWHRWRGAAELGDALYLSTLIPLPLAGLGTYPMLRLVMALERTRRQVELLSITDPLTTLHNRRHFMDCAQRLLQLARRHRLPLSMMLIDVDHFKRINDQYGHQAGDQVLVEVAQLCRATLRSTDLLARFGGEEFIVLLPSTTLRAAAVLAERLRYEIAAHSSSAGGVLSAEPARLTVSIGVVECSDLQATLDTLIRSADEALYAAKRSGRDRVHLVPPLPLEPPDEPPESEVAAQARRA